MTPARTRDGHRVAVAKALALRDAALRVRAHIAADPAARLTVTQMARIAGCTRQVLTSQFISAVGVPPGEYAREAQIDLVRRYLDTTSWSLKRIARETGYISSRSLTTAFLNATGRTPTAYREHAGNEDVIP